MKKAILIALIVGTFYGCSFYLSLVFFNPAYGVEQIDLTTPVTITSYRVVRLQIDVEVPLIVICLKNVSTGVPLWFQYEGAVATTMISQLNKANFSTNSLQKVILNRLIADGKLSGTVSGTAD